MSDAPPVIVQAPNRNVYMLIAAVQGELTVKGIAKTRTNTAQGYKFRGIEDFQNEASPICAKHGLVIIPRYTNREVTEREARGGGVLFSVVLTAEFEFVSAWDGSSTIVRTFGEAMDSSDKATNKAMSAAWKYAAMITFAIPTEGDDTEASSPEVVATPKPPDGFDDWVSVLEAAPDAAAFKKAWEGEARKPFREYAKKARRTDVADARDKWTAKKAAAK